MVPIILLFAAAACSGGGAPTAPSEPSASPTFQLTGRIVDGSALSAIASVNLAAIDGPNAGKSAATGLDGRYTLASLVGGGFTLRVQHPWYEEHVQAVTVTSNTVIDMRLTPKRTVGSGWTGGQLYATADGAPLGVRLTTVQVVQNGPGLNGFFTGADGSTGNFSGQLTGSQFTGTMNLELVVGTPARRCSGTATGTTGTATPDSISLSAPRVDGCGGVSNVTVTLTP